jgi:hypothetical protein
MNEAANTTTSTQFVWRRLAEPIRVFGSDIDPVVWLGVLALVLAVGFFYIGWMYFRDSRGVGSIWATILGLLRASVYVLLAWVFLMPANQTWEQTITRSKAVAVFDVSGSMLTTRDDIPREGGPATLTRQEKVLGFLGDTGIEGDAGVPPHPPGKINFFPRLVEKNPVTVYRVASGLDDNYLLLTPEGARTREEHRKALKPGFAEDGTPLEPPEPLPLVKEYWDSWLRPGLGPTEPLPEWKKLQKERLTRLLERNQDLASKEFFAGTNVPASTLAVLNRELNNRVQGIILFSDGRSTEGSLQAYQDLVDRAESAKIPIFVVAVGDERPRVNIKVGGLLLPQQVRPEDPFRAVVTVTGEGLADQPAEVYLDITHVRKLQDGKEEILPLSLIEAEDKDNPEQKRVELVLAKDKLTLTPPGEPRFDRGSPPRVEVEFPINPAILAAAAGVDPNSDTLKGKKWELAETTDSELVFQVRIPKHKLEIFPDKFHVGDKGSVRVLKKPMRVLLFASAPTREYQFLRTLLVRETDKKRMELAIHLQPPPGRTERRVGVVQDVPPERLLTQFPYLLDSELKKDDQLYDLASYDVILAFDPDWRRLTDQQMKNLQRWVNKGGGLVVVGGPINTLELARPGASTNDKYAPILDLYPVVLSDIRLDELERDTTDPWSLDFKGATPDMEFLKLEESAGGAELPFLQDWQTFFYGTDPEGKPRRGGKVIRGFYSYYPVKSAKAGTLVAARFTDPKARLQDGSQQPFIVVTDPASGRRVIWLGSGEMWRLRTYRAEYLERFWTKLVRYAGAKSQSKVSRRVDLYMDKTYKANQFIDVEAKIDSKGGEPLSDKAEVPVIPLKLPAGVPPNEIATRIEMRYKPPRDRARPREDEKGWFTARFPVRSPGAYELQLRVPETGDIETKKFTVTEANPELDNTRPDFARLYQLASSLKTVENRLKSKEDREALRTQLRMPRAREPEGADLVAAKEEKKEADAEEDLRLFFTLENAYLIPKCLVTRETKQRSKGAVDDLWDEGFVIWDRDPPEEPIRLSWVLVSVVFLLSLEWLIRKLLRLA